MAVKLLLARWGYKGGMIYRVCFFTNIHGKYFPISKKTGKW